MPIERPNQNNTRPLKPTLASNRTAKTPLTPRLAVAPTASSTVSSQGPRVARTSNGSTPRLAAAPETVTPVKAFLNSNITPRSSSRKSRVGGESGASTPNDTPSATPTNSRPTSSADFPYKEPGVGFIGLGGSGSSGAQSSTRTRSTVGPAGPHITPGPRLSSSNVHYSSSELGVPSDTSSLFFHANDAKPREPPPPLKKSATFYHANGKNEETPRRSEALSSSASSLGRSQADSQFFHADSISEARERPPVLTPPAISASPDLLPPNTAAHGASLRAPSPTKDWGHLSYRKGASQVSRPAANTRNPALSILAGPNTPDASDRNRRRSSTAASVIRSGHAKSSSLSSIDSAPPPRKPSLLDPPVMTPSPLHTENRVVSNRSLPGGVTFAASPSLTAYSGLQSPAPSSPTKNAEGKTALELMNDLAANARRERKVLDLEISNSSLLAINRSLEKEVRKQKAEIRRFRRMSRAGHFTADTIETSETFSPATVHATSLSDMSEDDNDLEDASESDSESTDSSLDEGSLSPAAQAERDEAHRSRDERRLALDLSKHRELLVDSQKMNQSLKHCLGWTEQLIKDGQKALEYKVHVSDVRLGGRVLVAEDDHEESPPEESRGLLSPWSPLHHAPDAMESPFFPAPEHVIDRDSGVDVAGRETAEVVEDDAEYGSPTIGTSSSPGEEFRPRIPGRWESYAMNPGKPSLDESAPLDSPFEERIRHLQASIDALEGS